MEAPWEPTPQMETVGGVAGCQCLGVDEAQALRLFYLIAPPPISRDWQWRDIRKTDDAPA
jgi:hypothetical protein